MKIKIANLTRPQLDWAVATCEGYQSSVQLGRMYLQHAVTKRSMWLEDLPEYSADWAQGGPIIEKAGVFPLPTNWNHPEFAYVTRTNTQAPRPEQYGPTPLIAAMRCYVASKLGEWIDVPEELP